MMIGFKSVILFSLAIASVIVVGAQGDDSLDNLLRRVLDQLKARNTAEGDELLQNLLTEANKIGTAIDRAVIIDLYKGQVVSSIGTSTSMPLTNTDTAGIASAFVSNHFSAIEYNGLKVGDDTYRLMGTAHANGVVIVINNGATIIMKMCNIGIIVAHSPKGGMNPAAQAMDKV